MELSYTLFDQTADALGCPRLENEPMRRHTTFQIGGPADRFVTVETLPQLKGARLVCVVRSSAQAVAKATHGSDFPFPVICDGPGVLYGYLGVEQTRGLLSWSFAAQKIYKAARDAGYHYDTKAPQLLPLTLVVGHLGKILFTHSGRSQTDLPEDCAAISEIVRAVEKATAPTDGPADPHCSDETLTLPDLVGWDN